MSIALRPSILLACLACACGPSSGDDDSTTSGDASSSTGETTPTPPSSTTTGPDATTGTNVSTGPDVSTSTDATTMVDDSTGTTTDTGGGEPVACYEPNPDPEDSDCCPSLSQPCPVVVHECLDKLECFDAPFGGPVMDPAAAQCMLAALAEGVTARLDQSVSFGFGGTDQQWLVSASGEVILVRSNLQDFSFEVSFMACELADFAVLSACVAEDDPQVLSDCLAGAVEGCAEVMDPVCPG